MTSHTVGLKSGTRTTALTIEDALDRAVGLMKGLEDVRLLVLLDTKHRANCPWKG